MKQMINSITNFLSSKLNLTILQCILYFVLGYMLKDNYEWSQIAIIFVILFGIQFITHIKGVSQGMFISEIMHEENHQLAKFLKKIEREHNKSNKDLN